MDKIEAENVQCPVCGFYCLGNGGVGCIDKPTMIATVELEKEIARLREELSDREDDIRTEQLWVTHWKEECDKLVHLIALLPSRRSK